MNKIYDLLARFFKRLSNFFEGLKTAPVQQSNELPRFRTLLAKDALTKDETKELAELASKFEGSIIILGAPIHATTEDL